MRQYLVNAVLLVFLVTSISTAYAQQNVLLNITIQGVEESKISFLPLAGPDALKPLIRVEGVKRGETATIEVESKNLPGEFVLRMDYRQNDDSDPYPSEKLIILNRQDIDLMIHPVYSNNPDSTWFQKGEKENTTYKNYLEENEERRNPLALLQNLLLNYDDAGSEFYLSAINEYERRRKDYNKWIVAETRRSRKLFVSNLFKFDYVPQISWSGSEKDRKKSLRENYFEGMDLSEPVMIKTSQLKKWMDGYVNLFGELATTIEMRDSLFTLAGEKTLTYAKNADPDVYGWMVDYFFNGFESFNIVEGIKMLEAYILDPECRASRKDAILMRLKGIRTLLPGTLAPNIRLKTTDNTSFDLYSRETDKRFVLLVFWSADCIHCGELVGNLTRGYSDEVFMKELDIVSISLDETDTEIRAWEERITNIQGWTHLRAPEGIRSKVVSDYYILGIPVMILLNSKTNKIEYLPDSIEQLKIFLGDR